MSPLKLYNFCLKHFIVSFRLYEIFRCLKIKNTLYTSYHIYICTSLHFYIIIAAKVKKNYFDKKSITLSRISISWKTTKKNKITQKLQILLFNSRVWTLQPLTRSSTYRYVRERHPTHQEDACLDVLSSLAELTFFCTFAEASLRACKAPRGVVTTPESEDKFGRGRPSQQPLAAYDRAND